MVLIATIFPSLGEFHAAVCCMQLFCFGLKRFNGFNGYKRPSQGWDEYRDMEVGTAMGIADIVAIVGSSCTCASV